MLVVEQGTVLDRIDYNILEASTSVDKANVHLDKTYKIEKSGRARGVIIFLGASILVCMLILVLRWT